MDSNTVTTFINKLISQTIDRKIKWLPFESETVLDGYPMNSWLDANEFHTIFYYDSYYCEIENGRVFLVNELNESGRSSKDDVEGYNLYLQPKKEAQLVSVAFDTPEIYRLKNAIFSSQERNLSRDIIDFMDNFNQSKN